MNLPDPNREYFERHVERGQDCWAWNGPVDPNGRPRFYWRFDGGGASYMRAARAVYQLETGEVGDAEMVLPSCGNRDCVNPAHLVSESRSSRMRRQSYRASLTTQEVSEIREEHARGERMDLLAIRYGVCASTVGKIVRRETWRHV